jgi:hypothetical protein
MKKFLTKKEENELLWESYSKSVNEGYDVGDPSYDEMEYDSDETINIPDSKSDYDPMKLRRYVTKYIHGQGEEKEWAKQSLGKMYRKYKNDPAFMYDWKDAFGNDEI